MGNSIQNIKNTISLFFRNSQYYNPLKAIFRHYFIWKIRYYLNLFLCEIKVDKDIIIKIHNRKVASGSGGCIFGSEGYYFPNNLFFLKNLFINKVYSYFVDCGANIGYYSILVAKNSNAKVIKFEPHPKTYEFAIENIKINNLEKQIMCYNLAIGAKEGRVLFQNDSGSAGDKLIENSKSIENVIEVNCIKLEKFLNDYNFLPEVIKIDVEGYENHVLMGMNGIINNVKVFIIECQNLEEIIKILSNFDFLGPYQIDFRNKHFVKNNNKIKEDWIFINKSEKEIFLSLGYKFE